MATYETQRYGNGNVYIVVGDDTPEQASPTQDEISPLHQRRRHLFLRTRAKAVTNSPSGRGLSQKQAQSVVNAICALAVIGSLIVMMH